MKKKKIALIFGVTGQDGSYLAELLLKKNYMDSSETEKIQKFLKLAFLFFKSLIPTTKNKKMSLTFGNWAKPYLKMLNKILIAK